MGAVCQADRKDSNNTMNYKQLIAVALLGCAPALGQETLPPLAGEEAPQTFEAMSVVPSSAELR